MLQILPFIELKIFVLYTHSLLVGLASRMVIIAGIQNNNARPVREKVKVDHLLASAIIKLYLDRPINRPDRHRWQNKLITNCLTTTKRTFDFILN